ncbi:MAG TPA: hypothetical protein VLE53_03015 [Gemmatimonadaceae bacterium]|nr:hypothetical protein [Gemmatimonadaceae bacterium]
MITQDVAEASVVSVPVVVEPEASPQPETPVAVDAPPAAALLEVNTTEASILHLLVDRGSRWRDNVPKVCFAAVLLTYGAMAIAAPLGELGLLRPAGTIKLPFLLDINIGYMFCVSFPTLLALILTDQGLLDSALRQVQRDGVLQVNKAGEQVFEAWKPRFRTWNIVATVLAVVVSGVITVFNYFAYAPANVGYWIASQNRLEPVGYVFLASVFAFYMLIPVYVLRSVAISLFLRDLVKVTPLRLLPFHPDKCGGLRPIGRLGLRNQYALSIVGINVALLMIVSSHYGIVQPWLFGLIIAAVIAYVVLGPLVFIAPLLPFRVKMLETKSQLMGEVAQRLRTELQRLRGLLHGGSVTKEDEELIDRLRSVGTVIDSLPVWPFDLSTKRKFLIAYIVPALSGAFGDRLLDFGRGFFLGLFTH